MCVCTNAPLDIGFTYDTMCENCDTERVCACGDDLESIIRNTESNTLAMLKNSSSTTATTTTTDTTTTTTTNYCTVNGTGLEMIQTNKRVLTETKAMPMLETHKMQTQSDPGVKPSQAKPRQAKPSPIHTKCIDHWPLCVDFSLYG